MMVKNIFWWSGTVSITKNSFKTAKKSRATVTKYC